MKKYWWHDSKSNTAIFSFASAVVLISVAFLAVYFFGNSKTETITRTTETLAKTSPAGIPEKLIIPSLGIDAFIQIVGLDAAGRMGIPTNFTDVAWYKDGPRPGDSGSAVIDGHLDNARDANAVFKNLALLKTGDDIYVLDKAGQKIHFKVKGYEIYNYNNAPTERVFDQSGNTARLNLVTCDGVWNNVTKNYSERLVVYSERIFD